MSFESALAKFKAEIARDYGFDDALVKIAIKPELFNQVMCELVGNLSYKSNRGLTELGEVKLLGVQLLAREQDKF